jgi:NarL family two-component system response regulator LiaR
MSSPVRVLVVDDHVVVRRGIRALLSTDSGLRVVGEAANGAQAIRAAADLSPDVILMDLVMPEVDGIEAVKQIKAHEPSARILVLTSFSTDDKVLPALKAGALGYLLKDSGPDELIQAIYQVYRGESSLHPQIARKLLREIVAGESRPETADPLTPREVEVLKLVAQGQSNHDIATELRVSEATVRTHVSSILAKLHLASRTQAALYALRSGLASLDQN